MGLNILSSIKDKYRFLKELASVVPNYTSLRQFINPTEIPFVIINFNQLYYLQKLVNFAKNKGFKKIVIIDNVSTYPPLLDYYKTIEHFVTIERMDENYGHLVFFKRDEIYNKYGKSFFILTDADIEPNKDLPENFMKVLLNWLIKKNKIVTKVGFALRLDDIPEYYSEKEKVLKWEKQFWEKQLEKDIYLAHIDTTFGLYKPDPKKHYKKESDFYNAIRIAGKFASKHGGWYSDRNNLTEEQQYYIDHANTSSSWVDTMKTQRDSPIDTDKA